jgi:hypothetical protein
MRLYPDGVAEGSPEECAAYKHIDAALTARNTRSTRTVKAIESGKPKPTRVRSQRIKPKSEARRAHDSRVRAWAREHGPQLGLTVGVKGVVPKAAHEAYEQAHASSDDDTITDMASGQ